MGAPVAVLLLAAGRSARMGGRDKLLEEIDGQPLLRRMARRALECGAPLFVTLPAGDRKRAGAICDLPVQVVPVADPAEGMAAALRAGIAALPPRTEGALIMLADMPEIATGDLRRLLAAFAGAGGRRIVRACGPDGTPGNPVVLPARLFAALGQLRGDCGARGLVHAEEVIAVPLPVGHATTDLDTPEDWAAWRRCSARCERR